MYENFNCFNIDCNVGKLLVCKDDPALDIHILEVLAQCQNIKEVALNWNDSGKGTEAFILSYNINYAYFLITGNGGNNYDEVYRVFKVDDSANSQQLCNENYFVAALAFDEVTFKDFMYCNHINFGMKNFEMRFCDLMDCYIYFAMTKKSSIKRSVLDFRKKIIGNSIQKLQGYLVNQW
jgi:hypothetical protein